jgi:putative oxidoreductase
MSTLEASLASWAPRVLSILRIIAALLFMEHGLQKAFAFPGPPPGPPGGELPPLLMVAAILEIGGGALLLLGFLTRPVAFVLSGMMAVAYFMAHAPRNFFPVLNGGEAAILFCFIFLYLLFAGGGAWSLDALIARNKAVRLEG